jgi:hypothetical protein
VLPVFLRQLPALFFRFAALLWAKDTVRGKNDTFSRTSQLLFNGRFIFGALTDGQLPPVMHIIIKNKVT